MPRTWRSVLHNQEHGRLLKPSHQVVAPEFETSAWQNDVAVNTGYVNLKCFQEKGISPQSAKLSFN